MSLTKYLKTSTQNSVEKLVNKCVLKPLQKESTANKEITLKAGKNTIGRNAESGVRDTSCSKRQLELDVDLNEARVKVKILGVNPCGINGLMAMQNTECELQKGDIIELVYGKHPYTVEFHGANDAKLENTESWESVENGKVLVYTSSGVKSSDKIAAYDMDHTIIKTKSGNVFPKNIEDWEINFPEVPEKLKRLYENGFKICLFTNQGGIQKGKVNANEFKEKIRKIVKKLNVPVQVFIAISEGYFRKPLPGMWDYLRDNKNENLKINMDKSFFVGDAAGRPEVGKGANKRRKDHSLADRLFAANVGISFYTPEEHFLNYKTEAYTPPEFDPKNCHDDVAIIPENAKIPSETCEMIIMVGIPGSGKSHFVNEHLAPLGYTVLNADTIGSTQACFKAAERALNAGNSCVIDNTNVDAASRKKFIELAKTFKVPCRSFVMNVTLPQIKHNLAYRNLTNTNHARINDMVFNMMKKKYKTPTTEEGFSEIVLVNLSPKFQNENDELLYKTYLVDK